MASKQAPSACPIQFRCCLGGVRCNTRAPPLGGLRAKPARTFISRSELCCTAAVLAARLRSRSCMGKSFLSEFPSFAESLEEFTVHAFEQQGWLGSRDQKDGRYSSQSFLGCRLRAGYDEHAQHALALVRSVRSFHVRVFKTQSVSNQAVGSALCGRSSWDRCAASTASRLRVGLSGLSGLGFLQQCAPGPLTCYLICIRVLQEAHALIGEPGAS